MKKLALISIICFLVLVQSINATGDKITWEGEVMLYCQEACVEGLMCNWVANVENTDTAAFTFRELKIVNENEQTLSFARLNFTLKPRWTGRIGVEGLIPKPTDGVAYYKMCLKLEQKNITEYYCQDKLISTPVTAAEETECMDDSDCGEMERCVNCKCRFISCGECEYVANSTCVPFECCADSDCGSNRICVDHKCAGEEQFVPENYLQEAIQRRAILPSLNFIVGVLIIIVMVSLLYGIMRERKKGLR